MAYPKLTPEYCRKNAHAALYSEGDTVIIHPDLEEINIGVCATRLMARHSGEKAKIHHKNSVSYKIIFDGEEFPDQYNWQDYMFVSPDPETTIEEFGALL